MTDTIPPMARALELAREAARLGEVPVGAVIVDPASGKIVAIQPRTRKFRPFGQPRRRSAIIACPAYTFM